ncbi:hypothetical protein NQ317_005912 [Molorchus minor]|uniref:BHLH domain-containing protein n=1 Tax=Molorchus minor TaxID=1323400 RepID=A0ABQ9JFA2_9CUCU|nr:hypothetical protein NQ317_005912 [Molorchus minor]
MSYREFDSQMQSCMFSGDFSKDDPWTNEICSARMSPTDDGYSKEKRTASGKQPLREKNRKNCVYRHVPHKDKPPQVVARRNARERRRVQAVNTAFVRLRKAVPIENTRGKRVSKVKTLQNAIEYIRALQRILQEQGSYGFDYEMDRFYRNGNHFDGMHFEDF